MHTAARPALAQVNDINFIKSVPIGSVFELDSRISYCFEGIAVATVDASGNHDPINFLYRLAESILSRLPLNVGKPELPLVSHESNIINSLTYNLNSFRRQ